MNEGGRITNQVQNMYSTLYLPSGRTEKGPGSDAGGGGCLAHYTGRGGPALAARLG